MEKLKNKNTVVLIISAALIVIAIVIAIIATTSSSKPKDSTTKPSVSLNAELIASLKDKNSDDDSTTSGTKSSVGSSTKSDKSNTSYTYEPGKYNVATKDDPLGLRIEPNTKSDKIIYIPKGEQVEVLAVWEDWGYVVYEKTGGWLSMNYLELVSGNSSSN